MKNKYLEKYGFDERECWDVSYTSRVWLYSHLKLYLESAGSVVNLGHCTDGNTILIISQSYIEQIRKYLQKRSSGMKRE